MYAPNGLRYLRVGGTRQRRFDGTSFEPQKLPENAQTPTRRVHAVLGAFYPEIIPNLSDSSMLFITHRLPSIRLVRHLHQIWQRNLFQDLLK
jgi:hypothetical protein